MVLILLGILNLIVLAALLGCLIGWSFGVLRLVKGRPLLEPEARLPSAVGFAEVLMAVGLWLVLTMAGLTAAQTLGWIEARGPRGNEPLVLDADFTARVAIEGTAKLAAIALLIAWLCFLDRHALRRLGIVPRLRDFKIGIVTAVMLIPPVLMIQQLLNLLTPYEHPVKDLIESRPTLVMGLQIALTTVIIAPIAEEFFFRGLLQGWFQRVARRRILRPLAAEPVDSTGEFGSDAERDAMDGDPEQPHVDGGTLNPYRSASPLQFAAPLRLADWVPAEEVRRWPWWPMVVTSIFFGLVHWGQGAAPVSLFFLAMGLSYVTRQTGRLWPAITVHFSLNACATAAMFLSAELPTEPPPLGP